eukprot:m.371723 g.371723  ORF g.371723 m.371723 type:complete len:53 (+) comp59574_c0_seq1:240-398(+)
MCDNGTPQRPLCFLDKLLCCIPPKIKQSRPLAPSTLSNAKVLRSFVFFVNVI